MLKPIFKRLLVKVDPVETTTASGLILAKNEKRERAASEVGTIVSLSDDCFQEYEGLPKVGDRVYFARHAGKFVTDPVTQEEFVILNDEDVVCIIGE